ncbi:uncharacterized protein C1orf131 homolog [Onychostruthus taczanowskii]|uniref:uncharacterized protein C1orf131 homolog n=1 Tax=Onychostruthus taczanowskii TaxID=356909 RepID=UPI001B803D7B|nr:uncharacterized protein C1orf131 homolog [Onychostruthus taczanowskii]
MGGAMSGATGAAGGQTLARPPAAAAMGPREPHRRLEAVLGTLYDLGEEPGGAGRAAEDGETRAVPPSAEEEEEEEEERREPQPAAGGRRGARGFFGELRAELSAAGTTPPPPAAPPAVEVVVFRGRKRKERQGPSAAPAGGAQTQIVNEEKNAVREEFNFEKARLEVHKFGITGYKKQEQRVWEQERAIMLGAKPPKKAHVNYRTYQEKLKEKKAVKDADKEKEHKGDSIKKKKKHKEQERKAKRKKSVPSIWPAGQVGKFRNGTLILQSRDIKKIKSSKVSK